MGKKRTGKDQSAMEYLMTYGWAVLIIAIVLALIFQLGLTNFSAQFSCLAQAGFLCSNARMSSGGALTVNLSYGPSSYPITITGLACNVTAPVEPPSVETTYLQVQPGQMVPLVFQCPIVNHQISASTPVILWIFYNTPTESGLEQEFAKGAIPVTTLGVVWNVTEWSAPDNCGAVYLLPYSDLVANPKSPTGVTDVATGQWSSFVYGGGRGWSYSTDYHNNDFYYEVGTIPFPLALLSEDNVCNAALGAQEDMSSHGYTAVATLQMSGQYTFNTITDDGTQIFYRPKSGGSWTGVFNSLQSWQPQAPDPSSPYTNTITFAPGNYVFVVDYTDVQDPAGLSFVTISPPPDQGS